ncbi:10436_t:CDS:2 [Acaulospora colombiana]|uniref:10436_t:CDS:1 n=1 Tax=Acaulospora colombiana TaxID=27376 RepID=A0ACA9KLX5_9GLOM|nr:10436_t:CDS:2 [Acaulospora colombiana]
MSREESEIGVDEESEIDALPNAKKLKVSPGDIVNVDTDVNVGLAEGPSTMSNALASSNVSDVRGDTNDISNRERGMSYRLRIENIPKYVNTKTIKDFLEKNNCGKLQVKKAPNWSYCYAHLKSREQQLETIEKLKDVKFKNKLIVVKADNITEQERQNLFNTRKKAAFSDTNEGQQRSPEEMLADQTTPLHRLSYPEQLKSKENVIKDALSHFRKKIEELSKDGHQPNWIVKGSPPVLVDMCCGTGTIGIALSKILGNKVEEIIGIEICMEAVEDAKFNAMSNEINNTQYILGPVEENLRFLSKFNNDEAGTVIAIVDPPRAGVHKSVIKALRQCRAIDYLLYISCDCNLATQNFIE